VLLGRGFPAKKSEKGGELEAREFCYLHKKRKQRSPNALSHLLHDAPDADGGKKGGDAKESTHLKTCDNKRSTTKRRIEGEKGETFRQKPSLTALEAKARTKLSNGKLGIRGVRTQYDRHKWGGAFSQY